jgi:hypothetical protein
VLPGINSTSFIGYINNIITIHSVFSCHFTKGALVPWQPATFGDYPAVDVSNRYFTARRDAQSSTSVPFSEDVDPNCTLTRLLGANFIHTSDNDVQYFERISNGEFYKYVYILKYLK